MGGHWRDGVVVDDHATGAGALTARRSRTLTLGGAVEIDVLERQDGVFLGLGTVRVGGAVLRSDRLPMHCEVTAPEGVSLVDLRVTAEECSDDGVVLELAGRRQAGACSEWMLHEARNHRNIAAWSRASDDGEGRELLRLVLRPTMKDVGGERYAGFAYQWQYQGGDLPVYKLHDVGSWEINGAAVGNEVWMRLSHAPPVTAMVDVEQRYSTEWYIPPIKNPYGFQYLPLQTELQGFTYTAHASGSLVTFPTELAHIRTLLEKPDGVDEILHLHEHCGDLASSMSTAPVEVLWAPSASGRALDRVDHLNRYHDMAELVIEHLHAAAGIRRERVTTYAMIEEWEACDLDAYRTKGLPKLLAAGVRVVSLANMFENNMNVHGVSNMCCTLDLKVADAVGPDRLRAFCAAAKAGGADVEVWVNTAVSTLTTMLAARSGPPGRIDFVPRHDSVIEAIEASAEPFVRNPTGAVDADHYAPVFNVINLRDATMREYWQRRWRQLRDEIGVGGFFLDSSFNLSSDKFHWVRNPDAEQFGGTIDVAALHGARPTPESRGRILSMYRAHLDLVSEMQAMGYRYAGEDLGAFGVHRHGPALSSRVSNLAMWPDCLAAFDVPGLRAAGMDVDDVFFRGLAYRMMWILGWIPKSDRLVWMVGAGGEEHAPTAGQLALLAAYSEVEGHMRSRHILPGEDGAIYSDGDVRVVWSFARLRLPLDGVWAVTDVLDGTTVLRDVIDIPAHRIVVVRPPAFDALEAQREQEALDAMPYDADPEVAWVAPDGPDLPYDGDVRDDVLRLAASRTRRS